jgi:hypothetical protein
MGSAFISLPMLPPKDQRECDSCDPKPYLIGNVSENPPDHLKCGVTYKKDGWMVLEGHKQEGGVFHIPPDLLMNNCHFKNVSITMGNIGPVPISLVDKEFTKPYLIEVVDKDSVYSFEGCVFRFIVSRL